MLYLSNKDLSDLTAPLTLVAALEQGLRDFAENKVVVPKRDHTELALNTLLTMPVMSDSVMGAKIVSVTPANASRGLPVVNGLMVISDGTTGAPLAVLDAGMLTAQRTGALGALGLKYTTPQKTDSVGIIGTGTQGTWQAIFACAVRPIRTIYFLERSDQSARKFEEVISQKCQGVRLWRCKTAGELLAHTEVIIAATTSNTPVLPDENNLLREKHFLSMGSFKPSMQELPNSVYALAKTVIVDSHVAASEVGDLVNALSSGMLIPANVIHLAQLVSRGGMQLGRTTVFKSVGMALYDLCAAGAFLADAQRLSRGVPLDS